MLAGELRAEILLHRPVVRVSLDDFHRPRAERHRRGLSPESYYEDAFDLRAFVEEALIPFTTGQSSIVTRAFDHERDTRARESRHGVEPDAVLLADGVFLQRPELDEHWHVRLFVDIGLERAIERGVARDAERLGGPTRARELYTTRYAPAQQRYLASVKPAERADWVLGNDSFDVPVITRNG